MYIIICVNDPILQGYDLIYILIPSGEIDLSSKNFDYLILEANIPRNIHGIEDPAVLPHGSICQGSEITSSPIRNCEKSPNEVHPVELSADLPSGSSILGNIGMLM